MLAVSKSDGGNVLLNLYGLYHLSNQNTSNIAASKLFTFYTSVLFNNNKIIFVEETIPNLSQPNFNLSCDSNNSLKMIDKSYSPQVLDGNYKILY